VLSCVYIILVLLQVKTTQNMYFQNSSSPDFPLFSLIQVLSKQSTTRSLKMGSQKIQPYSRILIFVLQPHYSYCPVY